MKDWIAKVLAHPVVAHAIASNERYRKRLGPQFAAGITYFSVLSLVPILMFAFSMLGLTVTVLRPELLDQVKTAVEDALSGAPSLSEPIIAVIDSALRGWSWSVVISIVTAAYSGSKWVGNLKRAVRVMWSEKFSDAAKKHFIVLEIAYNLILFFALLVAIGLSLGIAWLGNAFSHEVIGFLGWDSVPGIGGFFQLMTWVLTFVASWILFTFLFLVLPNEPVRPRAWLIGTLLGAFGFTVLQSLAGLLIGVFSRNAATTIFGTGIVLMLVFNLLATIILMVAAWVGTDDVWESEREKKLTAEKAQQDAEAFLREQAETTGTQRWAGIRDPDELRDPTQPLPEVGKDSFVRQDVVARGMRVNLKVGWLFGAATGLGIGATIVRALNAIRRSPR